MTERHNLLESIANTIKDYRSGEITELTPQHVDKWVKQFDEAVQVSLLLELDHVFKNTYFTKANVTEFLVKLIKNEKLTGTDPCDFWKNIKFLNIQQGGNSQRDMLSMFDAILNEQCGLNVSTCGANNPQTFLYLDDALFTGNRILKDIGEWIKTDAPNQAKVNVVTIAFHRGGQYYATNQIKAIANESQKNVELVWWKCIDIEDRKASINSSDVLRPISLPEDLLVTNYVLGMKYKPDLRRSSSIGEHKFFMTDEGRGLLEQEMLKAGVKIRNMCPQLNIYQRPLGNMVLETLGFGSMIVTFRNCPNNAPLALWAGGPWYPLFPRKTN